MATIKIKDAEGTWQKVPTFGIKQFVDAPKDSKQYARQDEGWTEVIIPEVKQRNKVFEDLSTLTQYVNEHQSSMQAGDMLFVTGPDNAEYYFTAPGTKQINANRAKSVLWSGVVNKPTTIDNYGITDAVKISDVRLTDARPASDVKAWAKADNKPTYTAAEVEALPSGSNAVSATKLAIPRTINGVNFDGTSNITVTAAANGGTATTCSGNAATATKLQTARAINGVNFDGTTAITVTANASDVSAWAKAAAKPAYTAAEVGALASGGTAASATKLATARTIQGVAFDGTANISLPLATSGASGLLNTAHFNQLAFYEGRNVYTTLNAIGTSKQSIEANLPSNQSLTVSGSLPDGRVLAVKCKNTTANKLTIALPTAGSYVSKDNAGVNITSVEIPPNGFLEISLWAVGTLIYIKTDA